MKLKRFVYNCLKCICTSEFFIKRSYTSLHWAAQNGHFGLAEFLIRKGAKLEVEDEAGSLF